MSLLLPAIIGGASTVLGNIIGGASQSSANSANLQAVRETNQANLDLYTQQFRDTYKLWQENNEYNSPAAQMQRLRVAGLNPALNMGSNPTGMAQAASAPASNPMQAAHVEPYMYNFSDIAANVASLASASKSSEEAKSIGIDNLYRNQWNIVQIQDRLSQIRRALQDVKKGSAEESLLKSQEYMLGLQARMYVETFDQQKQSFTLANERTNAEIGVFRAQNLNIAADTALKRSQEVLNQIGIKYQPDVLQSSITSALAAAQNYVASANLSGQMSKTEIAKARNILSDTLLKNIERADFKNKFKVYKELMPIVQQQAEINLFNDKMRYVGGLGSILYQPLNGFTDALKHLGK